MSDVPHPIVEHLLQEAQMMIEHIPQEAQVIWDSHGVIFYRHEKSYDFGVRLCSNSLSLLH